MSAIFVDLMGVERVCVLVIHVEYSLARQRTRQENPNVQTKINFETKTKRI